MYKGSSSPVGVVVLGCLSVKHLIYTSHKYINNITSVAGHIPLSVTITHLQDEDSVEDVCKQIIKQWTECCNQAAARRTDDGIYVTFIHPHSQSQTKVTVIIPKIKR